ncbi:hypothetical protein [Helicobacter sp. T3_23-1056]
MIILKIFYACWIAFFAFGWFISPAIGPSDRTSDFFIMLGVDIAPLLIYSLCRLVIKRDKKYLIMFCVLFAYYPFILILALAKIIY